MPKMKTHGGAKKRFRVTGSGHVKPSLRYEASSPNTSFAWL